MHSIILTLTPTGVLMRLSDDREHTVSDLAELFSVSRGTVHRTREPSVVRQMCLQWWRALW